MKCGIIKDMFWCVFRRCKICFDVFRWCGCQAQSSQQALKHIQTPLCVLCLLASRGCVCPVLSPSSCAWDLVEEILFRVSRAMDLSERQTSQRRFRLHASCKFGLWYMPVWLLVLTDLCWVLLYLVIGGKYSYFDVLIVRFVLIEGQESKASQVHLTHKHHTLTQIHFTPCSLNIPAHPRLATHTHFEQYWRLLCKKSLRNMCNLLPKKNV